MGAKDYVSTALLEHRFWLQILGDHARFLYHSLSISENDEIQRATFLVNEFDLLLDEARRNLSADELHLLNKRAAQSVWKIKNFKLHLIKRQLIGKIDLNLSPTFVNHMINELEEYQGILKYFLSDHVEPHTHPLHYHLLWQSDAIGHASSIAGSLDMEEKRLLEKSKAFQKEFEQHYLKALELAGYLRTQIESFPSLTRYNREIEQHMRKFMDFLQEITEYQLNNELLGTLNPLIPDHMLREECYYLMKLALAAGTPSSSCDPTRPRIIEKL